MKMGGHLLFVLYGIGINTAVLVKMPSGTITLVTKCSKNGVNTTLVHLPDCTAVSDIVLQFHSSVRGHNHDEMDHFSVLP